MKAPAILLFLALVSCGSNPGVVQTGPNTFMLSKSSAAGAFANMATLKAETLKEANDFAAARGARAEGISLQQERPEHGFPNVDYQFRLAGAGGGGAIPSSVGKIQIEQR